MLKEYFSLTNKERHGLFLLALLCLLIFILLKIRQHSYVVETMDLSALEDSVKRYYASPPIEDKAPQTKTSSPKPKDEQERGATQNKYAPSPAPEPAPKPIIVELNSATEKELLKIKGVGEFYARQIIQERQRLGGFSHPDELLQLYGMSEEKLEDLLPQISIDTSLRMAKIPLNKADSFLLNEIPAIDPYCAARIVKYREQLGGYYDTEQLLEIFVIDEERYQEILLRITLDTTTLRTLDINNDSFKTIMKHPYIDGYENTKAIFRYLDYGPVSSWEEFIKIPYLKIEKPERLKHYVKFNPPQKASSP